MVSTAGRFHPGAEDRDEIVLGREHISAPNHVNIYR